MQVTPGLYHRYRKIGVFVNILELNCVALRATAERGLLDLFTGQQVRNM